MKKEPFNVHYHYTIAKQMLYLFKHWKARNKTICPHCGHSGFKHGFFPTEDYYCTSCYLWNPSPSTLRYRKNKAM